ncbi:hypothetical protein [Roseivirga seohaensis]|nr:hypothetical protein [Roseivirga seohaensis]KOF02304.1 hypothetical protein OB69_12830 [Roseivirga seohaensis subsp. aquiponti]KYG82967.1 hypothetical protein AWW67_05950 [Roseivirga seohaensis]
MSDKNKKDNSGIPYGNKHVSEDPNRTPKGDDTDKDVRPKEGYVEPYNKKKYQQDPKNNK